MLPDEQPHCVFVCAPTPSNDDGSVNSSIVESSVLKSLNYTNALVVVKSTITPDVVDRLYASMSKEQHDRFCYNPEFLTEKNAKADFVSAKFHVMGGTPQAVLELVDIYEIFGSCESNDYHRMSAYEASFVKYTINSFLSTKVTFFNQLYDLVNLYGCNYNTIVRAAGNDERVGMGHTRVPALTENVDSVVRVYQKTLRHSYDFLHMTRTTAQSRRSIYLRKFLTSIAIIGYNTTSMNVKKSTTLHS